MEGEKVRHVLDEDVSRFKLANGPAHLSPQSGFGVLEAVLWACARRALAGEPAGDDIDPSTVSADVSNIVMDSGSGEPPGEDGPSPRIDFAEPCVAQSGEVQAVVEQADP